jgi:hypothetical protein
VTANLDVALERYFADAVYHLGLLPGNCSHNKSPHSYQLWWKSRWEDGHEIHYLRAYLRWVEL